MEAPTPVTGQEFLRDYLDGYLLADLETLSAITQGPGLCYFPALMTLMAGVELCGRLLQADYRPSDPKWRNRSAEEFWLLMYPETLERWEWIRSNVRNGLAHETFPSGPLLVRRGHGPHLVNDEGAGLRTINLDVLERDFRRAIDKVIRPKATAGELDEQIGRMLTKQQRPGDSRPADSLPTEHAPTGVVDVDVRSLTPSARYRA